MKKVKLRIKSAFLFLIILSLVLNGIYHQKYKNDIGTRQMAIDAHNNIGISQEYEIIWKKIWGIEYKNDIGTRQMAIDAHNNIFICGRNGSKGILLFYNTTGELLGEYTISCNNLFKQEINITQHIPISGLVLSKIFPQFLPNLEKSDVEIKDIKINKHTNELFLLGWFQSPEEEFYTFIIKYLISNSSIHEVWTKAIKNYIAIAFTIDNDSNVYIPLISSIAYIPKFLLKLSSDGDIIYTKHFKPFKIVFPWDIETDPITGKIFMTILQPKIIFREMSKTTIIEISPKNGNIINEKRFSTPLISNEFYQSPYQSIAFSPNKDIFVSWSTVTLGEYKSKLIKLDKNLNILFEKTLPYVVTDMVILGNRVVTSGALISINGNAHYGSVVYNASNGRQLFIVDLGPIINTFNPDLTNRMRAIEADKNNELIITGGEGAHSDSLGYISAIETIKFILSDDKVFLEIDDMFFFKILLN